MMIRFITAACSLSLTALISFGSASASGFNQFVGFGDSTMDAGYFRYHTSGIPLLDAALAMAIAHGLTGGWAGNGVMNTTLLAESFGLSAAPIGGGGTNYANGGATTVSNDKPVIPTNVTTLQQIDNYLASVNGIANPNALYLIKSGDNDATYVTSQGPAWLAAHPNYLNDVAANLASAIARLQAAGARTIVVRNSYDSAIFAGFGGDIASAYAAANARTVAMDTRLWSDLAAAGVNFVPADNNSLFSFVAHNPTLFGFTASSVLSTNGPSPIGALVAFLTPEQHQSFLFIDGLHLTTAGQTIEADYTASLLTAPQQISLLAESALQDGLTRTRAIQRQIFLSQQHRGPKGINAWISGGANESETDSATGFVTDSGIPFFGSAGIDYQRAGGPVIGLAFTVAGQDKDFSTGGGFDQVSLAPSLYAAYRIKATWLDATASYGFLQDEVERQTTIGKFIDLNTADPDGRSALLAVRGGRDFILNGTITTGPVVGILAQRVDLDGFTEKDNSGVTALSFAGQTRDSLISQLGWRAMIDLDRWQPFVEGAWHHQWADRNETITTSLTSVAAPSFIMDAAPIAEDWATASFGTSCQLTPQLLLNVMASAVLFNAQMTSYGGEIGLSYSF